jgi:hypothetical protein
MLLNTKTSAGFFSAECTSHTKTMALFVLLDITDGLFKPIPHTFSNSCCYSILLKPVFTNFETVHTYQDGWWVEVLL